MDKQRGEGCGGERGSRRCVCVCVCVCVYPWEREKRVRHRRVLLHKQSVQLSRLGKPTERRDVRTLLFNIFLSAHSYRFISLVSLSPLQVHLALPLPLPFPSILLPIPPSFLLPLSSLFIGLFMPHSDVLQLGSKPENKACMLINISVWMCDFFLYSLNVYLWVFKYLCIRCYAFFLVTCILSVSHWVSRQYIICIRVTWVCEESEAFALVFLLILIAGESRIMATSSWPDRHVLHHAETLNWFWERDCTYFTLSLSLRSK